MGVHIFRLANESWRAAHSVVRCGKQLNRCTVTQKDRAKSRAALNGRPCKKRQRKEETFSATEAGQGNLTAGSDMRIATSGRGTLPHRSSRLQASAVSFNKTEKTRTFEAIDRLPDPQRLGKAASYAWQDSAGISDVSSQEMHLFGRGL